MPADRRRAIRIGCSGWNYASWKDVFYEGRPARLWLEHYARHFATVELNNTFYRLPRREAVATWERTVPERFCFAVKASRYLTHIKRLRSRSRPRSLRGVHRSAGRLRVDIHACFDNQWEGFAMKNEIWLRLETLPGESAQHFRRTNDWEAFAIKNALWLKQRLSS